MQTKPHSPPPLPEDDRLNPAQKIWEFCLVAFCLLMMVGVYIKIVFF